VGHVRGVSTACVRVYSHARIANETGLARLSARSFTGALRTEGGGGGDLARELVRQLLTGLSHPAREKDHLARRADISNDTPRELFGALPTSLRSFVPFPFSTFTVPPPIDRARFLSRSPLVPASTEHAERSSSSSEGPGVSVIAPRQCAFLPEGPANATDLTSPLRRRTGCFPRLFYVSLRTYASLSATPPMLLMSLR